MNDINDCINELKIIFKYETINFKEDYINNWGWCEDDFYNKFYKCCLFVINCEYMPKHEELTENINIHYDLNYNGSIIFNQILEKYNLNFEWVDNSGISIFYKDN